MASNLYLISNIFFSADMLRDSNIPWVILGHSERRDVFKESDEHIGKKVGYALSVGLKVTQ